jgi:formate hydrogenlyase subunit 3/multisubunit Na+/H+ antiporter MnhD subunit
LNPIPGPILLFILPILTAVITYLVRRWATLAAFVAVVMMGVLSYLCFRLPLDRSAFVLGREVAFGQPVVVLGQSLQIEPAGQLWLAFIFSLAMAFYLLAWRLPQGRAFLPSSLVILGLYVLMGLLQLFPLRVLVFAISVILAIFMLQGEQFVSVRGAQRYLVISLLAVPLLLAAAWMADPARLTAQNAGGAPAIAYRPLLPAALGFGLLLAAFPFSTWMPAIAAEAPPLATAFVFTVGQAMALFLALTFLRENPLIAADSATAAALQIAGMLMAASGGVMAAVQRDFGRLLGYAALSSFGILLLALVAGGSQGVTLALLHQVGRGLAITLMAAALAILRRWAGTDHFAELRGVARRLPVATLGLILGGLALAGFPFTAGFPTHWAVGRAIWSFAQSATPLVQETTPGIETAQVQNWVPIITLVALVVSSAGVIIGLLRGLDAMRTQSILRTRDAGRRDGQTTSDGVIRQPLVASLMVLALIGLTVVLGLYPQLFLALVERAAQAFSAV